MKITVIIRDDSPMIFCGDNPSYRRVTIELTPEQEEQLELKFVGQQGKHDYYEQYSQCFIEE